MRTRWDLNWLVLPLLCVFAVAPLTHPGYFWGAHDARHSVYFLLQFDRSIGDGVLYPRWMPDQDFGYGYPFWNIYSPGAFYVGEFLHLAGMDFVAATKAVFGLGLILSGLTMYVYARSRLGRSSALLAAVAYVYVPYRLADVYVRGALAESLAFVFFPLVLWAFGKLLGSPGPRSLAVGALAIAGLVFSHYGVALLFGAFLVAHLAFQHGLPTRGLRARDWLRPYLWSAAAGALGLGLSAVLLLPAVVEYSGVRTDQWAAGYYDYREHFVYLFQLFAPYWGFGTSSAGPDDTMTFQLGVVPAVLAMLSGFRPWRAPGQAAGGRDAGPRLRSVNFHQLAILGVVILMLPVATPIWEVSRLAAFAQFPWRLLAFVVLPLAFLCGSVLERDTASDAADASSQQHACVSGPALPFAASSRSLVQAAPLVALVILASYPYLSPQVIDPAEGPVSLGSLMRFQRSANEMTGMTAWATRPTPPTWSPLAEAMAAGREVTEKVVREGLPPDVMVATTGHSSILDRVRVRTPQALQLRFYTAYYPGWRAYINGGDVPIQIWGDTGGIAVGVPPGEHTVELRFEDTPPRVVGQLVSLGSLVILISLLMPGVARLGGRQPGVSLS